MTDRFDEDPQAAFQRAEAQRQHASDLSTYAESNGSKVASGTDVLQRYPWMRAGVALAMLKGEVDEATFNEVAQAYAWRLIFRPGDEARGNDLKFLDAASRSAVERRFQALQASTRGPLSIVGDVGKGVARVGFSALESGYQEVQGAMRSGVAGVAGLVRSGGDVSQPERNAQANTVGSGIGASLVEPIQGEGYVGSQSSLGILLGKFWRGDVDWQDVLLGSPEALGSGFFPGGEVREEQRSRAYRSANIGGRSVTLGRLAAYTVTEPGTTAYNVLSGAIDAGAIVLLDPANVPLAKAGQAVKARRYFEPVEAGAARRVAERIGLLDASRRTTIPEVVEGWMKSAGGQQWREWLTDTDDFYDVWTSFSRKIPVRAADELAKASTIDEVDDVLRRTLGYSVVEKPRAGVGGWRLTDTAVSVRRSTSRSRLLAQMPGSGALDTYNPDALVTQIDAFLRNAKVDDSIVRQVTADAAQATVAADRYQALKAAYSAVEESLVVHGVPRPQAKSLTSIWDSFEKARAYNIDPATGLERALPEFAVIGGTNMPAPTPQILEQFMGRYVALPDRQILREIRTATGAIATPLQKIGAAELASKAQWLEHRAADVILKAWKPLQILRPAYVLRVVGDEQARMASAGLHSAFSHPLSFLAIALADDGRIGKMFDDIPGMRGRIGRYGADVAGDDFAEVITRDRMGIIPNKNRVVPVDDEGDFAGALYRGFADVIGERGRVQVRGFHLPLRPDEPGAIQAWADNLQMLRDNPVARQLAAGKPLDEVQEWFWSSDYRSTIVGSSREAAVAPLAAQVSTRAGADQYVAVTMQRWVDDLTKSDRRLVDFIAHGRADDAGETVRLTVNASLTKEAKSLLERLRTEGLMPEHVLGAPSVRTAVEQGGAYDIVVSWLFDTLATRPSNWASRSVTFRQFYWRRAEELLSEATPEARAAILDAAKGTANLPTPAIKRLESIKSSGADALDLDAINALSGRYAADETKKLLYDLTNRGQFFDAARVAFPFGEAWKEVLTTWFRLLSENPKSIRTLQRTVEGARGAGVFYKDPVTEQEMYAVPGSAALVSALTDLPDGVRLSLQGSVAGLSIAGSMIPGVGPAVQWPAGTFLPDKPNFDVVRSLIFPYGGEDEGVIDTLTPSWLEKVLKWDDDPQSDREMNALVGNMLNLLSASGEYDLSDTDDMLNLVEDAVNRAQRFYVIRGLAQAVLPSAPSPKFETREGDERWHVTQLLVDEFRSMQDDDYETAPERFLARYGEEALMFMVPLSRAEVGGLGASSEFGRWERENADLVKEYPNVAGFFAPTGDGFDPQVYARQFRTGQRSSTTQRERQEQAQAVVAEMVYRQHRAKIGERPNEAQRAWLADVRDELHTKYPLWDPDRSLGSVTPGRIREVERLVAEPKVAGTALGKAVALYLEHRQRAADAAGVRTWQTANAGTAQRAWLRDVAEEIVDGTPEFARIWDELLSRELKDDEPQEQEMAA